MLAELVSQGKLPPVQERLPDEPLVVQTVDKIGKYGGTLRFGVVRGAWHSMHKLRQPGLLQYNMYGTEISVDMARSFEFSSDLKILTFELRKDHKWSDGAPFTVDDIIFWWQDIANNKELQPGGPGSFWKPEGALPKFTKISDTTLRIEFEVPYPVVVDRLGRPFYATDGSFIAPKHYLEKWHIDYNAQANDLAKQEGFDGWPKSFKRHFSPARGMSDDTERPSLFPWVPEKTATDQVVYVRNAYFHQVDSEGNQLPYIDRIQTVDVPDGETFQLKLSSGDFDFEAMQTKLDSMPVYKSGAQSGGYGVLQVESLRVSQLGLYLNRTVKDRILYDLFNDRRFRVALSLAIDRKTMSEAVFFGFARPFPPVWHPSNSFFKAEWADEHIAYDPAQANQILDEIGLSRKDAEGYRLRSDGKRLSLVIEMATEEGPKVRMLELVSNDWKEVGVEAIIKLELGSLASQRRKNNDQEIEAYQVARAIRFGRADPKWWAFMPTNQPHWARQWIDWFKTGGTGGIEPPQLIKDQHAKWQEWLQTEYGSPEYDRVAQEYFQKYYIEEYPFISTVGLGKIIPVIISNRLKNVPREEVAWSAEVNFYNPYLPTQWYIEE